MDRSGLEICKTSTHSASQALAPSRARAIVECSINQHIFIHKQRNARLTRAVDKSFVDCKMANTTDQPWHASFPEPRLEPGVMPQKRAMMVMSMKIASMLIIDVRRTDYEGGAIRGSLNIPAQGFFWNRGGLYVRYLAFRDLVSQKH